MPAVPIRMKVCTDGSVEGIYNDKVMDKAGLGDKLGPKHIARASNVEFNLETNRWEAITKDGELIAHGPNRAAVIEQEVSILTQRIMAGTFTV